MAKLNLRTLSPVAALLVAAAWFQPSVAGSDLWWHLASGRDIWNSGRVPHTDIFSYTFAGQPWTNHEWLWDVIYWGVYQANHEAVAWFNLALVTVIFSLVYANALRLSGSHLAAGIVCVFASACSHWFLDIRPHLWTLLFVGILLLTRDQKWAPWLWPALMLVWVNLHSGFVFGFGLIGLNVLVLTIERSVAARRPVVPWVEWLAVAACVVAMVANPYGYSVLEYPMAYLDRDSPFRGIIEWLAPPLSSNPAYFAGRFWWFSLLVAFGVVASARRSPFMTALVVVTFSMAVTSRRFIPLFAITAAPIAALFIAWIQRTITRAWPVLTRREATVAVLLLALVTAGVLWRDVRLAPRLLDRWTEHWFYPTVALRYLQALDPPERILNYYNWGGYMFLHAPGIKAFIDGRANTLYGEQIYNDYINMIGGAPGYKARLARWGIELVFVPVESGLVRALTRNGPAPWKPIYVDRLAAILVPPDSPILRRPLPNGYAIANGHPDIEIPIAQRMVTQGQLDKAMARLEKVIERDPLMPIAYGLIAQIHARRGELDRMRSVLERGLRNYPREVKRFRQLESRSYELAGDRRMAVETLRRAVPMGPFSQPGAVEHRIRQMEAGLAPREKR